MYPRGTHQDSLRTKRCVCCSSIGSRENVEPGALERSSNVGAFCTLAPSLGGDCRGFIGSKASRSARQRVDGEERRHQSQDDDGCVIVVARTSDMRTLGLGRAMVAVVDVWGCVAGTSLSLCIFLEL